MTEFNSAKLKAFDKILTKKFGDSYTGFGETEQFEKVKRVPIECISLNEMLGGGLPVGRVVEVYGNNSVGKSALATHFIASYQKQDKVCMWVDAEHTLDPEFMGYCGVDLNKLCKVAPNSAEEALEALRMGMKLKDDDGNPVLSLVVLDSVAALTPASEFEDKSEIGSSAIGKLARLMSTALKQLVTLAAKNDITLILINQERACNMTGYGPKTTTSGGNAVKYYSSIRLDMNRTGWVEEDKQKVGQEITIEAVKNKTSTPFKKAVVDLIFPTKRGKDIVAGVDVFGNVIYLAIENDIIKQAGAWFNWLDDDPAHRWQGKKKVVKYFLENEEEYNILYEQVKALYNDTEETNNPTETI